MRFASSRWMRRYLRVLAAFYALGALLHLRDVLGLRLSFSEMPPVWKAWILCLLVLDSVAAVGLWRARGWGVALFLVVAASQLIAEPLARGFTESPARRVFTLPGSDDRFYGSRT